MPVLDLGQKASFESGGKRFLEVKEKGDKVTFRIAGKPYYDGKHFLQNDDKSWNIQLCPRIMEGAECGICKTYFQTIEPATALKAELKKLGDADQEKKVGLQMQIDEIKKKARPYQSGIQFYYPVLDRDSGEAKILRTTIGVRNQIDVEIEAGVNPMLYDYTLLCTKKVGADYYKLTRIDSAQSKPLSDAEKASLEKARTLDLEKVIPMKPSTQMDKVVAETKVAVATEIAPTGEPPVENVPADDIPF